MDQDQARLVVKGEVSSSQVRVLEVSKAIYLSISPFIVRVIVFFVGINVLLAAFRD